VLFLLVTEIYDVEWRIGDSADNETA